jgi:hypothetical protein
MVEPFSLVTTALSLGQQCATLVGRIHGFIRSAHIIDTTLNDLARQIGSLSAIFQTIGETFKICESFSPHMSSPLESEYWKHVLNTMEDCTRTLQQLDTILAEVRGPEDRRFGRTFTQLRYELREKGIDFCRRQIDGYCQTMNISLQLLSLYDPYSLG